MKFIFLIVQKVLIFCLDYLYNYIDKNSDGKISKEEIKDFSNKIKKFFK